MTLKKTKTLVERCALIVSITSVVRAARLDGDARSYGFITPIRAAAGSWVAYECDLRGGVARLDTRLRSGAEIGAVFEIESQPVGDHLDRLRWRARCPSCGVPARLLYVESCSNPAFGCRACLRLVYRSTRHRAGGRAAFRVQQLRVEAGGSPGPIDAPFPAKQPRLRWATWLDLEARAVAALAVAMDDVTRRRGQRLGRLRATG